MVCVIFYITLATLRRRPGGSQEGALAAPGLLTLALAWPLSGPGLSLAVAWAVAWPWPGRGLALALALVWPWPVLCLALACPLACGGLWLCCCGWGCGCRGGGECGWDGCCACGRATVAALYGGSGWRSNFDSTVQILCKPSNILGQEFVSTHTHMQCAACVFLEQDCLWGHYLFLFCFVFAEGPRWKEIMQLSVLTLFSDSHAT